jgi:hypothetical protein
MAATLHGGTQRGGEVLAGGDRQVTHAAAAYVGGVGPVDPITVGQ